MLGSRFLGVFIRRFTGAISEQSTKNQLLADCV